MSKATRPKNAGPSPIPTRAGAAPAPSGPARHRDVRNRWALGIGCGAIVAGLLAIVGWRQWHPADLTRAEAAYSRQNLGLALRLAEAHLARRPASRAASLLAARCLSRLGHPDRAEPFYRQAGPLDEDDQHVRAYALVLANRREAAIRAYREILERRPRDVLALSRLAAVLISESRFAETLEVANRLIEIPEGAVIGQTLAGVVYHNTRDAELAVFAFDRVLQLDPDLRRMPLKPRSMFWTDYAHNLLVVGRWADARRVLEGALVEGGDARVADLLAQSYYLEGALDQAERYWRLALEWDSGRYGPWWRLGKLQLQRGRPAEAAESLRRAASIQPQAVGPLYSLSLAYRRLGRAAEAERCMKQADRIREQAGGSSSGSGAGPLFDSEETAR